MPHSYLSASTIHLPSSSPFMTPSASTSTTNLTPSPTLVPGTATSHWLPPPRPHGVRAHLAEILPLNRHAIFAARVTIHQLWNVPLVAGHFRVRWKFQNVQRVSNAQRGRMTRAQSYASSERSQNTLGFAIGNGKGKQKATSSVPASTTALGVQEALSADGSASVASSSSGDFPDVSDGAEGYTHEARGHTPYEELYEHNVAWGQTVTVPVSMAISKETNELQACDVKLVVEQLIEADDKYAPQNPRLGDLTLNLAEYVGEGAVSRRYLLRHCKTNATLQLTIALTQISGETQYRSPPLQKSEVHAGVAKLLQRDAHISVNSPASYSPPLPGSGTGLNGNSNGNATTRVRSASFRSDADEAFPELIGGSGQRTADNIIEAIFNPVPTTSKAPSPFTYYVSPRPRPPTPDSLISGAHGDDASGSGSMSGHGHNGQTNGGVYLNDRPPSIAPSAESDATSASRSSAGTGTGGGRAARWWHRLAGNGQGANANTGMRNGSAKVTVNVNNSNTTTTLQGRSQSPSVDTSAVQLGSLPSSVNSSPISARVRARTNAQSEESGRDSQSNGNRSRDIGDVRTTQQQHLDAPQIVVRRPSSTSPSPRARKPGPRPSY